MQKKKTIIEAQMLAESAVDKNLKNRYGTSVDENMSRSHAKDVQTKIHTLRDSFKQFLDKDKFSPLTFNDLTEFFIQTNVK